MFKRSIIVSASFVIVSGLAGCTSSTDANGTGWYDTSSDYDGTADTAADPNAHCNVNTVDDPTPVATKVTTNSGKREWRQPLTDGKNIFVWSYETSYGCDIVSLSWDGSTSKKLATIDSIAATALGKDHLFVLASGEITKLAKDGSTSTIISSMDDDLGDGLAIDAKSVYSFTGNGIYPCDEPIESIVAYDQATGNRSILAENLYCPSAITVDGSYVYFISRFASGSSEDKAGLTLVQRVPLTGGKPQELARLATTPHSLAVSNGWVYLAKESDPTTIASSEDLVRVPVAGGAIDDSVDTCTGLYLSFQPTAEGVFFTSSPYDYSFIGGSDNLRHSISVPFNPFGGDAVAYEKSILFVGMDKSLWRVDRQ
jgi:hypothetical protein